MGYLVERILKMNEKLDKIIELLQQNNNMLQHVFSLFPINHVMNGEDTDKFHVIPTDMLDD